MSNSGRIPFSLSAVPPMYLPQATTQPPPPPPIALPEGAPGAVPQIVVDGQTIISSPRDVYQAARSQRDVLRDQLSQLEEKRLAIARRLREGQVSGPDKAGLEARLVELDQRIALTDNQVAQADARLAAAAGTPGAVAIDRSNRGVPDEAFVFGGLIMIAAILPLSIAWAKRILRRGQASASVPRDLDERFTRLEQALDAVAIEVERVGESQRYYSKMLGPGVAQPIEVPQREAVRQKI